MSDTRTRSDAGCSSTTDHEHERPIGLSRSLIYYLGNRPAARRFRGVRGKGERRRAMPAGARWGAGRRERQRAASLLYVDC